MRAESVSIKSLKTQKKKKQIVWVQREDSHLQSEVKLKPTAQNGHRKPSLGRPAANIHERRGELPAAVFRKKSYETW